MRTAGASHPRQQFPDLAGPTFDVASLPPGDYLASLDYGDLRSERPTAPLQVAAG